MGSEKGDRRNRGEMGLQRKGPGQGFGIWGHAKQGRKEKEEEEGGRW